MLLAGCGDIDWFPSGTTPEPFSFTNQDRVDINTTITSAPITILGNSYPADISVSAGSKYSIDSGPFVTTPGKISAGQTVEVQHTSAATYATSTSTVLTVGGLSATFTSTTRTEPPFPVTMDSTGTITLDQANIPFEYIPITSSTAQVSVYLINTNPTAKNVLVEYVFTDADRFVLFRGTLQGTTTPNGTNSTLTGTISIDPVILTNPDLQMMIVKIEIIP